MANDKDTKKNDDWARGRMWSCLDRLHFEAQAKLNKLRSLALDKIAMVKVDGER